MCDCAKSLALKDTGCFLPRSHPSPPIPFLFAFNCSFEGDIGLDALLAFEEKFMAGELTPSLKSEEPSDEDLSEAVKVVKGKSFQSMVIDNGKSRSGFFFLSPPDYLDGIQRFRRFG